MSRSWSRSWSSPSTIGRVYPHCASANRACRCARCDRCSRGRDAGPPPLQWLIVATVVGAFVATRPAPPPAAPGGGRHQACLRRSVAHFRVALDLMWRGGSCWVLPASELSCRETPTALTQHHRCRAASSRSAARAIIDWHVLGPYRELEATRRASQMGHSAPSLPGAYRPSAPDPSLHRSGAANPGTQRRSWRGRYQRSGRNGESGFNQYAKTANPAGWRAGHLAVADHRDQRRRVCSSLRRPAAPPVRARAPP